MARTEKKARYGGLPPLTGAAHAAQVLAGRFVKITGTKTTGGTGGAYPIAHCGLGERAFGVAELDSADPTSDQFPDHSRDLLVPVARRAGGQISRVTAGETLAVGDLVQSDATGKAIKADGATLATGVVGDNNAITWTARDPEKTGLTVTILDPAGNNVALSVDVDGDDIVVTGATDGASALTSTATLVMAAIAEHDQASQLVTVASTGASSGAGVVTAVAETPLAGAGGVVLGVVCSGAASGADAEIDLF